MDYNGDNNDFYGTDGYGGGGNYGSFGDTCSINLMNNYGGCDLYCANPPLTYNDPGTTGWVTTNSIVLGQVGDTGVSYSAIYNAWNTFATIKISTWGVDGAIADLAVGGFIDQVRITKTDSAGAANTMQVNWNQFTLVDGYYEASFVYNDFFAQVGAGELAVLDGEQYTFSINVKCINGAGYAVMASNAYSNGGSPEPSTIITYNN